MTLIYNPRAIIARKPLSAALDQLADEAADPAGAEGLLHCSEGDPAMPRVGAQPHQPRHALPLVRGSPRAASHQFTARHS